MRCDPFPIDSFTQSGRINRSAAKVNWNMFHFTPGQPFRRLAPAHRNRFVMGPVHPVKEETLWSGFQDRRIIVTGGGSGIGQATVLRLLSEAGTVHAADVNADGLEKDPRDGGGEGRGRPLSTGVLDVSDEDAVGAGVAEGFSSAWAAWTCW